jgi:hypothetical protein
VQVSFFFWYAGTCDGLLVQIAVGSQLFGLKQSREINTCS